MPVFNPSGLRQIDITVEVDFLEEVKGGCVVNVELANLRYDAANKRVYVGFGEDETGAIGTVDATSNERLEEE